MPSIGSLPPLPAPLPRMPGVRPPDEPRELVGRFAAGGRPVDRRSASRSAVATSLDTIGADVSVEAISSLAVCNQAGKDA